MKGFTYVAVNPALPGLIKVGCSENPEKRILDLSSTGVPGAYSLLKKWAAKDMYRMERTIKDTLDFCRWDSNREFFSIREDKALEIVDKIVLTGAYALVDMERVKKSALEITDSEHVGRIVRTHRETSNCTQKCLALTSGTGKRLIVDIERGKPTLQLKKVIQVLHTLGLRLYIGPKYPIGNQSASLPDFD